MDCMSLAPVWDISNPSTDLDLSTEAFDWHEIREQAVDVSNKQNYRLYTTDQEAFFLPSSAHLQFDFQVKKSNGDALAESDYTALVADSLSCFEDIVLRFDNNEMARLNKPGKAHYMKALCEYSEEFAKSVASNHRFYPDSASDFGLDSTVEQTEIIVGGDLTGAPINSRTTPKGMFQPLQMVYTASDPSLASGDIRKNPNYNPGFRQRVQNSTGKVTAFVPLSECFPILEQYNRVMKGLRLEVEANKVSQVPEATFGALVGTPTLEISRISMWIARVKPSLAVLKSVENTLVSNSQARFNYDHMEHFALENVDKATTSRTWRIASEHAKPLKLIVGFQRTDRKTNHKLNTLEFDTNNVSSIHVRINGVQYPVEQYQPSNPHDVNRIVSDIYRVGCKNDGQSSSLITRDNWDSHNALYVFDLNYQPESSLRQRQVAEVELRWTLSSAPSVNYDVQAVLFSDRQVEIDMKNGKVSIKRL